MPDTAEHLTHHWAMDTAAADVLAGRIDDYGHANIVEELVGTLDPSAVEKRDDNRRRLNDIYTLQSDETVVGAGACSWDQGVDYAPLDAVVEEIIAEHPRTVVAERIVGAKPRTELKTRGNFYSLDPAVRKALFESNQRALRKGIPIITEITQPEQLGALAPYLSGAWIGARDMPSTTLRDNLAAYHLPAAIKNANTANNIAAVENAVKTVRAGSEPKDDSGVLPGTIASDAEFVGIPTGVLPVGEGNPAVAIVARGYPLDPDLKPLERRGLALQHLSDLCELAHRLGCAVIIDGSHDVPEMFEIKRSNPNRFIEVMKIINAAIIEGDISRAEQIRGVLVEAGPVEGRTDKNLILDKIGSAALKDTIKETLEVIQPLAT